MRCRFRAYTGSKASLSVDEIYEAHAVAVHDGIVHLLVVDDHDTTVFEPRGSFDVVDPTIPSDWICNTFPNGPIQLVMGPPFIAKDLESFDAMADQRREQVEQLWRRIDAPAVRTYLAVAWSHEDAHQPMLIYRELDVRRHEVRKIELFFDGRWGWADGTRSVGGTVLVDSPVPSLADLSRRPELTCDEITRDAFELLWIEYAG